MTTQNTAPAGKVLDAVLHLLDRQIYDTDGLVVSVVDDIEISLPDEGKPILPGAPAPEITDLLMGPTLGTRLFGGQPPLERMMRIPWSDVARVGTVLVLRNRAEGLPVRWVEHWLRDHVIARIPGGRHDPE
ncbi:PRC-barrel domain-containing protein [Arthrobacter sp. JSM 101049]|uniref:PRC-barrel domain-containing protein n=1 Tax=Arthrobacter sp. JSM 101049 TaxID=929097 RepID=UPI003562E6E1